MKYNITSSVTVKLIISSHIFVFLFFLSCSNKENYEDCTSFSTSEIPERIKLTGEIIELDDVLKPMNLYIKDSILFIINHEKGYFISTYNTLHMTKIGDFIPFGSGPNEVLDLKSIQFTDSLVWIFDKQRQQILQYETKQFTTQSNIDPCMTTKVNDVMVNNALVINNKLFTTSFSYPDARFSIYDMQGKFQGNIGSLPDAGIRMSPFEKIESFFCNMALNTENNSVFVAYMSTDLIEIYDSEGNLKTRKHGPDHFFPVKKESAHGETVRVHSIEEETRDAYFYPVAFPNEIWVLYSGKKYDPSSTDDFLQNKIMVFDWNANPLREYVTDIPFYSLAIDKNNNYIYGITLNPDFSIVRFNY